MLSMNPDMGLDLITLRLWPELKPRVRQTVMTNPPRCPNQKVLLRVLISCHSYVPKPSMAPTSGKRESLQWPTSPHSLTSYSLTSLWLPLSFQGPPGCLSNVALCTWVSLPRMLFPKISTLSAQHLIPTFAEQLSVGQVHCERLTEYYGRVPRVSLHFALLYFSPKHLSLSSTL